MSSEPEQGQLQLQTPGEILRKARKEKELSQEEMASQLNLKIDIIKFLESDQYERLAAPTYTRGYLRSYARAIDVDPESLIKLFNSTQDNTGSPEILPKVSRHTQASSSDKPVKIVTYLITLSLALLILIWWQGNFELNLGDFTGQQQEEAPAQTTSKSALDYEYTIITHPTDPNYRAETSPDDYQEIPLTAESQPTETDEALISALPEISASHDLDHSNPPINESTSSATGSENPLTLLIEQESWIEIHDANNKRLYLDLAKPGQIINVSGPTPYSLLLGNANGVRIQFEGKDFDLTPHIRQGVARLKLGE